MTTQIRPSVTNPSIANVYKDICDGLLVLAPEFQRKFVWTPSHQEQFIDTVLKGLPFPEIYVSTGSVDIDRMRTTRNVIDGQQRLTTIKRYIEGVTSPLTSVTPYERLTDDEKRAFLSYEIVMRDLGVVSDDIVREIFRRINLTKFKLDAVEIHNAVYDGEFISAAKKIVDDVDIRIFGVFRESEFTRMSDLHFVLMVMSTIESEGYFLQDVAVENFIERYNDHYPGADRVVGLIKDAFRIVAELKLPEDSMWFRKANFFTLIVEICFGIDKIPADLRDRLLRLEDLVVRNKLRPDTEFGRYYSYMYQNTSGRIARVTRAEVFQKYCLSDVFD